MGTLNMASGLLGAAWVPTEYTMEQMERDINQRIEAETQRIRKDAEFEHERRKNLYESHLEQQRAEHNRRVWEMTLAIAAQVTREYITKEHAFNIFELAEHWVNGYEKRTAEKEEHGKD